MSTYFKIHRDIIDHWVFSDEKTFKLWIWLISKARVTEGTVCVKIGKGTVFVKLQRGETLIGRESAEKEIKLDSSLIYRRLQKFKKEDMVTLKPNNHYTIVKIVNYEYWQGFETEKKGKSNNQSNNKRTTDEQQTNTKNNDKNVKNDLILPNKNLADKKDFIDVIVEEFARIYEGAQKVEYVILNKGKERQAAGKLLNLYKKKYPKATTDEALKGLSVYFDACMNIQDAWLHENMSLPIIISKFNSINNILKHGKGNRKGATVVEIAKAVSDNFAVE